ncbi:hypothetical protein BYT27DRAFT_7263049 [Phlegmacium glaucopus]|nr:hypothetical protein BYT27DRAFT_7263049 [Phlegmacium glaucopus]
MGLDSRIELAILIPHTNTYGRCMYYGFDVTEEWLIAYAKVENGRRGCYPDPPLSNFDQIFICLPLLSSGTGIRTLRYKPVFDQGAPIPPKSTRQTLPLPIVTHIIAICSSHPKWFQKRPTQQQFDKLKQIMGKEPQWWVSFD